MTVHVQNLTAGSIVFPECTVVNRCTCNEGAQASGRRMVWNRLEGTKAAYSIPSINDADHDDDDNVDNNDN